MQIFMFESISLHLYMLSCTPICNCYNKAIARTLV